jgi:hypothetical protein
MIYSVPSGANIFETANKIPNNNAGKRIPIINPK